MADPQSGQHDTAAMATEPRDRNQDPDMRVVVWQWGRYGAGPRLAALLAEGFEALGGIATILSLSNAAEILRGPHSPRCDLPVQTYAGLLGLAWRFVRAPATVVQLSRRLRRLAPRIAVCAMPGPLDLLMVMALRRVGVPVAVVVHDAQAHPGDEFPLLFRLQRALLRRVNLVIALSEHVASRSERTALSTAGCRSSFSRFHRLPSVPSLLRRSHRSTTCAVLRAVADVQGLDLLAEALRLMGPRPDMEVRVVGQGPESTALADLRACRVSRSRTDGCRSVRSAPS